MRKSWVGLTITSVMVGGCVSKVPIGDLPGDTDTDGEGSGDASMGTAQTLSGGTEGETGDPTVGDTGIDDTGPIGPGPAAVDILFVIDNSGSMGQVQAVFGQEAFNIIGALDGAGLDYRIGITTTDNGNTWCGSTTPEAGNLRVSSCRARQSEFVFNGAVPTDVTQEACLDVCELDNVEILATATADDPNPKPRPWLQGGPNPNVGNGTLAQALACALPQGINGCGFESHLESAYKSMVRSDTPAEDQFGFAREDAHLVIVFVSDEVDCSSNPDHDSIFLPSDLGGNQVFWSDPDAASPSSAVCWNAGVACSGDPADQDCVVEDYAIDGTPTDDPAAAVLHPLSRYRAMLEAQAAVRAPNGASVFVYGFLGVPVGYENGTPLVYADSIDDPQFQSDFGIGPGCSNAQARAVPPVRLKALAEDHFGPSGLFSVCALPSGGFGKIVQDILAHVGE